jgi:hypothetical protein
MAAAHLFNPAVCVRALTDNGLKSASQVHSEKPQRPVVSCGSFGCGGVVVTASGSQRLPGQLVIAERWCMFECGNFFQKFLAGLLMLEQYLLQFLMGCFRVRRTDMQFGTGNRSPSSYFSTSDFSSTHLAKSPSFGVFELFMVVSLKVARACRPLARYTLQAANSA